jgi:hypothetical protein
MGCYYFDQPHIDDLIISIDSNDIRLQWLPIPIALIYHIYRSTEPYFDITGMNPIESTTVTYYIDTGALSGNKYYYRVTYEY